MATRENKVNSSNKSDPEILQNLNSLIDLLSELNRLDEDISINKQKNKVVPKNKSQFIKEPHHLQIDSSSKKNSDLLNNFLKNKEKNKQLLIGKEKSHNSVTSKFSNNNLDNNNLDNKSYPVYTDRNNHQNSQITLLQQTVKKLENKIESNQKEINEVIDSVNSLLSLTTELISLQPDATPQGIMAKISDVHCQYVDAKIREY